MSSDSGIKTESPGQDVFRRLVRSLSGKNGLASPSPQTSVSVEEVPTPQQEPTTTMIPSSPLDTTGEPLQRVASSSSSITKARVKIADRLKQLGKEIGKLRKSSDKSVPASPRITIGEVSPRDVANGPSSPGGSSSNQISGHAKLLSMVAELEELEESAEDVTSTPKSPNDPPEPSTLAKRIQALVDSLPFPTPVSKRPLPISKNPKPPARDDEGRPIPPPGATPIKDSRLISFLSSPTIMNGSTVKGRPSIWSVLERIGAPAHSFPPSDQENIETGGESNGEGNTSDSEDQSMYSDNSSVMVYSPLIPGLEDHVELAELVPVGQDEEAVSEGQTAVEGTSWTTVWPLSIWYGPSPIQSQAIAGTDAARRRLSGETVLSPPRTSIDRNGRMVRVQTARAWVPSTTKLSVQAMWWGYRIYLPPPVLAILSDKTLEATKRAAMITTALTWFFNNLPVDSLPPPVRPAALLLQRLAPYLGYIGTFISWSWSTIKGYDIGYGVTLTATWLLPVALIPGTWRENDFPKSPTQSPIPLPPQPSEPASPPTSPPTSTSPSLPSTTVPSSPITVTGTNTNFSSPASGVSVTIPVPPTPIDIPPVPPSPVPIEPQAVPVGSPLMERLLHGPVLSPVPLPDEDAPFPLQADAKPKKDRKSRAKALFTRSQKQ